MERPMFRVGMHMSIAGSIDLAVDRALSLGCTTLQIFTRNPRGWRYNPLPEGDILRFREKLSRADLKPVVAHMPYLPNLASPRDEVYLRSVESLKAELERCHALNIPFLVTHLGSHLGSGREKGLERFVAAVDGCLEGERGGVTLLLENTAGTRNSIGAYFQDLQYILERSAVGDRLAVCLDTCHAFAAGYDLRSEESVEAVMEEFDRLIGLDRIRLIHANDSKGGLGSKVDRHEHIGLGRIGREGFKAVISYNKFKYLPYILETQIDSRRNDRENLEEFRGIAAAAGADLNPGWVGLRRRPYQA
ncbi:MAG: deoxyribonuclease IV [Candidatus Bathyarchaeia archaeon]